MTKVLVVTSIHLFFSFFQGDPISLLKEGKQQYKQKNFKEALTIFTNALEEDSKLVEAYFWRALVKEKWNDLAGAEADYTIAISLDAQPLYYNNRGLTRLLRKQVTEAEEDYRYAIKLDSTYGPAYVNLAMLSMEYNDTEKACEYLQAALEHGFVAAKQLKSQICL